MQPYGIDKKTGEHIELCILKNRCKGIALKALRQTKKQHKIKWNFISNTKVFVRYKDYEGVRAFMKLFEELLEEKGFVVY